MLKENCIAGLPVTFKTKSTGQGLDTLRGTRQGRIITILSNLIVVRLVIGNRRNYNDCNFLPSDLEPLNQNTKGSN